MRTHTGIFATFGNAFHYAFDPPVRSDLSCRQGHHDQNQEEEKLVSESFSIKTESNDNRDPDSDEQILLIVGDFRAALKDHTNQLTKDQESGDNSSQDAELSQASPCQKLQPLAFL